MTTAAANQALLSWVARQVAVQDFRRRQLERQRDELERLLESAEREELEAELAAEQAMPPCRKASRLGRLARFLLGRR